MKQFGWIVILAAALASACSEPSGAPERVLAEGHRSAVSDAIRRADQTMGSDGPAPFEVAVALTDSYGNPSEERALAFSWTPEVLGRINRENIDRYQLADLATVTILSPRGVMALAEWCDENGRVLTPRLCGTERRRAEDAWVVRPRA